MSKLNDTVDQYGFPVFEITKRTSRKDMDNLINLAKKQKFLKEDLGALGFVFGPHMDPKTGITNMLLDDPGNAEVVSFDPKNPTQVDFISQAFGTDALKKKKASR